MYSEVLKRFFEGTTCNGIGANIPTALAKILSTFLNHPKRPSETYPIKTTHLQLRKSLTGEILNSIMTPFQT